MWRYSEQRHGDNAFYLIRRMHDKEFKLLIIGRIAIIADFRTIAHYIKLILLKGAIKL